MEQTNLCRKNKRQIEAFLSGKLKQKKDFTFFLDSSLLGRKTINFDYFSKGDSGGPVVVKSEGRYFLVGAPSFGSTFCDSNSS